MNAESEIARKAIARELAETRREVDSLVRARQIVHSTVVTSDGSEQTVADILGGAASMAADFPEVGAAIEILDDSQAADQSLIEELVFASEAAADEAHEARLRMTGVVEELDAAKADAAKAIDQAANALTTADGKNSRRRGVTQPDPPEGGWAQGDQWIRDVEQPDGNVKAVEALVWNGAEFVREQILASELLVLGEDGDVRIANGVVSARTLTADAIDGMLIRGVEILGGRIDLATIEQVTQRFLSNGDDLAKWMNLGPWIADAGPYVDPELSLKHSTGTSSIAIPADPGIAYMGTPEAVVSHVEVTFLVDRQQEVSVKLFGGYRWRKLGMFAANTWHTVTLQIEPELTGAIGFAGQWSDSMLYIDRMVMTHRVESVNSSARIYRDTSGKAIIESTDAAMRTRLVGGGIQIDQPQSPAGARISLHPGGISSNDSTSRIQVNKDSDAIGTGVDLFAGDGASLKLDGGRSTGRAYLSAAAGIDLKAPVIKSTRGLKSLWEGGLYMLDTHTANLSERVSDQLSGILMLWSRYTPGASPTIHNDNWSWFFIPKEHTAMSPSSFGVPQMMTTTATANPVEVIGKYVYVRDTSITGHAANSTAPSNKTVLRQVFGV